MGDKRLSVIAGVLGILFGLILLLWPGITLATFILLFAIYLIAYGIFRFVAAFSSERRWTGIGLGAVAVLTGIAIIAWPEISALVLFYLAAGYLLLVGIFESMAAFATDRLNWWLLIAGIINFLFSLYIFFNPLAGGLTLIIAIAIYNILYGIVLLINGVVKPPLKSA